MWENGVPKIAICVKGGGVRIAKELQDRNKPNTSTETDN